MEATALESGFGAGTNLLKKFVRLARGADTLTVAEKVYSIAAFLAIVTAFLLVMSVQSARLQTNYRHMHASSAEAAIGVGRINALIYAIVMDSRGIYMSADRSAAKPFAEGLVRRNRELADALKSMEKNVGKDDAELFASFRQRIIQFIEFRRELVRRGVEISPAAAREWGDNDANRTVRSKLNSDIEALERIYEERAREADELADDNRYAAAYLFALGLAALMLAALNVVVMRTSVVGALADITLATDRIAQGDVKSEVPHLGRHDEIGRLARAVQNFRDAVARIFELEELELGTAQARDAAMTDRDKFNDKYQAKKWQLSAAINSMPQGLIMLDGKANVVAMNSNYRRSTICRRRSRPDPPSRKSCSTGSRAGCSMATSRNISQRFSAGSPGASRRSTRYPSTTDAPSRSTNVRWTVAAGSRCRRTSPNSVSASAFWSGWSASSPPSSRTWPRASSPRTRAICVTSSSTRPPRR